MPPLAAVYWQPGDPKAWKVVKADKKKEGNETFFLDLTGAFNALFTKKRGIGTILHDD